MYMCYLDESGTVDLTDEDSKTLVLLGLAIPANEWKATEQRIIGIKFRFGLADDEVHVAWMNRPYPEQKSIADFAALDRTARRTAVESARQQLLAARSGKTQKKLAREFAATAPYIHLTRQERRECTQSLANAIGSMKHLHLFAEAVNKQFFHQHCAPRCLFEFAFTELLQRFQMFLVRQQSGQPDDEVLGLMVQDQNDAVARRITNLARQYHQNGTGWTEIDRIIETPLFVDSTLTSMVQLSDLCSYAVRRMIDHRDFDLVSRIWKRFDREGGKVVGACHYTDGPCSCRMCVCGCVQPSLPLVRTPAAVVIPPP